MSRAWLGMGSNIDAERQIRAAIEALREAFESVLLSPIYRCPSDGFEGREFINLVALVETELDPEALRDWLHDLEDRQGRRRDVPKFSDRYLDIDILLYDDRIQDDEEGLQLPRDDIERYVHVLKPLAELSPELVYPGRRETIAELRARLALDDSRLVPVDPALFGLR
jgi:2-amino-4-hydroxy-6-hydroxymethyldihydropteridine diphosphokinase